MKYIFERVSISEQHIIFDFLREAAKWLCEKGIDHWQNWHHPSEEYINWIINGLKDNQFYIVKKEDEIIAIFRLQYYDELFWGKRHDKAGYIHSFTTKRSLSGNGIGKYILKQIENILKADSFEYLRLDCDSDNEGLCNYYENYGFIKVGYTEVQGEKLTLYEKKLD